MCQAEIDESLLLGVWRRRMALLDGKRQWKRTCSGCKKKSWEGSRFVSCSLVICSDCHATLKKGIVEPKVKPTPAQELEFLLAHISNAEFVEKGPFLVDKYNAFDAALSGAFNYVKQLVEEGKVGPNSQDYKRVSLLDYAVKSGNTALVRYLVSKGGDLDFQWSEHLAFSAVDDLNMLKCIYELEGNSAAKWIMRNSKFVPADLLTKNVDWTDAEIVMWLVDVAKCNPNGNPNDAHRPLENAANVAVAKALVERGADAKYIPVRSQETLIFRACWYRDFELVKYYESLGVDVAAVKCDGTTALNYAVSHYGNLPIVEYLVSKGCDPLTIVDNQTYLFPGVSSGDVSIVKFLIDCGIDVTKRNGNGENCLTNGLLCYSGDLAIEILQLLEAKGLDIADRNSCKRNYLQMVCGDNTRITRRLLDFLLTKGMGVNEVDKSGMTPILMACTANNTSPVVIPWLLEHGADINVREEDGQTVLHYLARDQSVKHFLRFYDTFKAIKWVSDNFNGEDPLVYAVHSSAKDPKLVKIKRLLEDHPDYDIHRVNKWRRNLILNAAASSSPDVPAMIDFFIAKGVDVHAKSDDGDGVLHSLGQQNYADLIKRLVVEHKVDVNVIADRPLLLSRILGWGAELHYELLKFYVEQGINIHQIDRRGESILWDSTSNFALTKLLIEKYNVDFKRMNNNKETLMFSAMANESFALVEYLVQKGLDINAKNYSGTTPLLNSVPMCSLIVYKKLEELGADLTAKDGDQNSLLHLIAYGSRTQDPEIAKYLIDEKGLDMNEVNECGETPLSRALSSAARSPLALFLLDRGADFNIKDKQNKSPLHKAAEVSSLFFVKMLIEKGADPTDKTEDGKTLLHYAVESADSLPLLRYLIGELHLDVTVNDDYSNSLLVVATQQGGSAATAEVISYLVSQGVDVNSMNSAGENAMFTAVQQTLDVVKLLHEAGCEINYVNESGQTPLFNAVSTRDLDIIKYILSKGVDINAKGQWSGRSAVWEILSGWNPVEKSVLDVFRLFIEAGLDLTAELDNDNRNLLWPCAERMLVECINFLCDIGVDPTQIDNMGNNLHFACCEDSWNNQPSKAIGVMQFLMGRNVNIKHRNHEGQTCLFQAVNCLNQAAVTFLLDNELDVNQTDNDGRTPLIVLSDSLSSYKATEQTEMLKLLVQRGAKLDARSTAGRTVLYGAAAEGMIEIMQLCVDAGVLVANEKEVLTNTVSCNKKEAVEWLIAHGADVSAVDSMGRGAAHAAAQNGNIEILELLLQKGASVEPKSLLGETPLMAAADSTEPGALECVKLLAKVSATSINRKNNDGKTALLCALMNDKEDIVKILVEHGADLNIADDKKMTPLHHAAKKGNEDFVKLFLEKGAKKDVKDKKNRTPYMTAVGNAQMDVAELLKPPKK